MMKKVFVVIFGVLSVCFLSFGYVYSLSVADFTPILDKKVASLKTTEEKVKFLTSFSNSLGNPKWAKSKNAWLYKSLQEYCLNMLNVFEHELMQEQAQSLSSNQITAGNFATQKFSESVNNFPRISDNFSNVDAQSVRKAILSWHNEERNNVGVNAYTYNLDLEGSATVWANNLAEFGKTKNLHLRNAGDGYYNYNSLLNRFSGLGITFGKTPKGASSFSETIGYGYYKCSKSDCTQDLIDSVKKTRTGLIMKEKSSNGSHYRAAVMKHFTQMGAGIAFDKENNRYYIVIHYGVEF